jgi:hypothetical protein
MKKIFPFLIASSIILMASNCQKNSTPTPTPVTPVAGSVELNIKAIYNAKPLVISQVYDYNGKKVIFERLQFFMAYDGNNLAGTLSTDPPKTALFKFTSFTDTASANAGASIEIPMASTAYASVNFGIGIPKSLNAKLPKDFSFPDGLADSGNFWDSWQSYIFSKLEGKIDKDNDGIFETPFTLHTGGDDVFTPLKFTKSYTIQDAKKTKVSFELSINELVKGIDLTTVNSSHQIGAAPIMKTIMTNYTTALTVK